MSYKKIFDEEALYKATFILESPYAKLSDLTSSEIKDLAVVWCYYSGKIEGNTYTYCNSHRMACNESPYYKLATLEK